MRIFLLVLIVVSSAFIPVTHSKTMEKVKMIASEKTIVSPVTPFTVSMALYSRTALNGVAGYSKDGRPIEAFYFPGSSDKKALVIGGVHGSELSAIEVAKRLIEKLSTEGGNYYSVIVIPCLFPDNAYTAVTNPQYIGGVQNIGRYSYREAADPNRQMPALGRGFSREHPFDAAGRPIEPENQLLLQFIQEFQPHRIINLHAIRTQERGGVYADPRTDSKGRALGYTSDSGLAVDMGRHIESNGGRSPGNNLSKKPTALYYTDPLIVPAGEQQKRNLLGSRLPGNRGYGVSLGSWASTAVNDPARPSCNRPAIRLLTMEFPGYQRPEDYSIPAQQQHCSKQVTAYSSAIYEVFLGNVYVEEDEEKE